MTIPAPSPSPSHPSLTYSQALAIIHYRDLMKPSSLNLAIDFLTNLNLKSQLLFTTTYIAGQPFIRPIHILTN